MYDRDTISNIIHISTIKDFKQFTKTSDKYVIYLYSHKIVTCQKILEEKQLIDLFRNNSDIPLLMIDAIKHPVLVSHLKANYYPIFLLFKNNDEIDNINGNYEDVLDILESKINTKLLQKNIQVINCNLSGNYIDNINNI